MYVATEGWVPARMLRRTMPREEARAALLEKLLRWHGPVTKYEAMERYGFPEAVVEQAVAGLDEQGLLAQGEYVPTKSFPQCCWKTSLEEIHRLTLLRLRKEMEPATAAEYADFLIRWQHRHPETQVEGLDGLRDVLGQLQGAENYQIAWERDLLPGRVRDYDPSMLDRLCYSGEALWRRFDHERCKRGFFGFCFRDDRDWLVDDPREVDMAPGRWDDDIPEACDAVRRVLARKGACFYDDILRATKLDERLALRAIWHLAWTGEATCDSFEAVRHSAICAGLSACYDLATRPGKKGVTNDDIVRRMREYRRLDPTLGRWAPTERLVPESLAAPEPEQRMLAWARLLLRRYGIVSREMLGRESAAPPWKGIRRALVKQELLGKVRRGFFVQDVSGEQYALPEAVEALRDAKLRHPDGGIDPDEPMIALSMVDPANPFGSLFPLTDEGDEPVKVRRTPMKYVIVQAGQPLLAWEGQVTVLADLTAERAEEAMRALLRLVDEPALVSPHGELHIRDWNGHPIDVSPARHLLAKLGFVDSHHPWKGYVYDGTPPAPAVVAHAASEMPEAFERAGKEGSPVAYDADWIVGRSPEAIRDKVRELIETLPGLLPPECELVFEPRRFVVRYRGVRGMHAHLQLKQLWLHVTHRGWRPGIQVSPDTDLQSPDFADKLHIRFERTQAEIDALLARGRQI